MYFFSTFGRQNKFMFNLNISENKDFYHTNDTCKKR